MREFFSFDKILLLLLVVGVLLARCTSSHITGNSLQSSYTVQRGDTLSRIAMRFGIPVQELVRTNGIANPNKLEVGEKIKIPDVIGNNYAEEDYPRGAFKVKLGKAAAYKKRLLVPLKVKYRLASRFGYRGSHFHKGLDFAAPYGTPIYATHDGQVVISGTPFSGYGNMVAVAGDGLLTLYAHNSRNLVSVGDMVRRGQKIAEVGATGRATGYHLHYETRIIGRAGYSIVVDPVVFY